MPTAVALSLENEALAEAAATMALIVELYPWP